MVGAKGEAPALGGRIIELKQKDLRAALEFQGRVAAARDLDEFRSAVVRGLFDLIPCDVAAYNEINPVTGENLWLSEPAPEQVRADGEAFMRNADSHPVLAIHQGGDPRALMLSDFLTGPELRDTGIYQEFFGPLGLNSQLATMVEGPAPVVVAISANDAGRSFVERDRALMDLVRPFVGAAFTGLLGRRSAESLAKALEEGVAGRGAAVILLAPDRSVAARSAGAQEKLHRHFGRPDTPTSLPAPVMDWIVAGAESPLLSRRCGATLQAVLVRHRSLAEPDLLMLDERRSGHPSPEDLRGLGLTRREAEVLALIAIGRSNAAIAEALVVSPLTVKRHAENIYAKLGVEGRTAAAARAHDAAEPPDA